MVHRIILYIILPCMILALVLSFAGVSQITFGDGYRYWLASVNSRYEGWSFEIPKIPKINPLNTYSSVKSIIRTNRVVTVPVVGGTGTGELGIFSWFKGLINFLIMVINGITTVINVLITIINVIINILKFVISLIWGIKDLPYYIRTYNSEGNSFWWYNSIS